MPRELRIGVYVDLVYRERAGRVSTDLSFVLFLTALASRLGELVVFGRLDPAGGCAPYELPSHGVRFVPLPHYPRTTSLLGVIASVRRTRRVFARELAQLDAVLLFGPHPLALALSRTARRRGTPVFLGVRQDFPEYIRRRLPRSVVPVAVPAARLLERRFRRLARRHPAFVAGNVVYDTYLGIGARAFQTSFSLVRAADVVRLEEAVRRDWSGTLRVLTVGRLDAEKNPLLLADVLANLRLRHPLWTMIVAGTGPLAEAVAARAASLGVADALQMPGYVPFGAPLWELYRSCHAFLHVSLTEGEPQVLVEAHASGLPVVATDVGGVGAALRNGALGELVPPADAAAAATALERLRLDPKLRKQRIAAGLQAAEDTTLDAEVERVSSLIRSELESREHATRGGSRPT